MLQTPLRVLVVDDDEDDFILTGSVLREAFGDRLQLDWERDWERALHTILRTQHDVYLIDYRLGARDGLYLLKNAVAGGMRGPVIMLTGHDSRDTDLVAMEEGASDYLVKAELTPALVERSIRYAINHYRIEEQLRHLALYDPLTGVANRALFMDRLAENLALRRREENHLALLLMDLDHFKDVNDRLGHPAGDSLLRQVANRLMYSVRDTDTVARLGGDEFAVIAAGLDDPGDAAKLADKLMETMEASINVEGEHLRIRLSMGIALAPGDGDDPDQLFKRADVALYQAKGDGRGIYRFYDPAVHASLRGRREMHLALSGAIERGELSVEYQPKIQCSTGLVVGAEALLRWKHPVQGLIPPAEFIPIAERSGLIVPIGAWVIRTVCEQVALWASQGMPHIPVAVNVSMAQLIDFRFVDIIGESLKNSAIPASCLELEVTESLMMEEPDLIKNTLGRLRDMGVCIAIDDFGTGYSCLAYLSDLPVDKLKIDQSLVAALSDGRHGEQVASAIIALGKNLRLDVIAEGVETPPQFQYLKENHCDDVQGFYFSPPVTADAFAGWYRHRLDKH
jgi:diguanylate cyclase